MITSTSCFKSHKRSFDDNGEIYLNTKHIFKSIENNTFKSNNIDKMFKKELKDEYREINFDKESVYDFFEILYKISYENDIEWISPYEFEFKEKKYKIFNIPQNFCRLHYYLLKDFHEITTNSKKMKYLLEEESFNLLDRQKKSKIINNLYFMEYFPFGLNYNCSIFSEENKIFYREKKLYFFNLENNCLKIDNCNIDYFNYTYSSFPENFNNNHKIILKKFLRSFIFPVLPSYKNNVMEKDKLSFRSKILLLKIKKEINSGTSNQNEDVIRNFRNFELDYEDFFKLPLKSIVYFVKRWATILWSCEENSNSNLKLFPEKEIIIPYIKNNKVEWKSVNIITPTIFEINKNVIDIQQ